MNVLCACEESQEVTFAFRCLGIEAFSCDKLLPIPEPVYIGCDGRRLNFVEAAHSRPGYDRQSVRSHFFPGVTFAMAEQWGSCSYGQTFLF